MTFFGALRTDENGEIPIPLPAGLYDFFVELTQ